MILRKMNTELRWAFNASKWKPTNSQLKKALSSISEEEVDRIQQFRFKEDFKLSLAGRLMIRKAIRDVLHIEWNEINLSRTEKGKPVLCAAPQQNDNSVIPFQFNVSHDGDFTVLVGSCCHNIGVDIMKYTRPNNTDVPNFFKLMRRQFVPEEWEYINHSSTGELGQLKAFYRLWCLKESYVKALGVGIGTNSAEYMRFQINEDTRDTPLCCSSNLYVKGQKVAWDFHEQELENDHVVAVAIENNTYKSSTTESACKPFQFLSFEELTCDLKALHNIDIEWWENYSKKENKISKSMMVD